MLFILISLILNLNAYAGNVCSINVIDGKQSPISITLKTSQDKDNSFEITTTKAKESPLQIRLEDGKIISGTSIPELTVEAIKTQYSNKNGNGDIVQTISKQNHGIFIVDKNKKFIIDVVTTNECKEQDVAIILLVIDKWFYV